MTSSAGAHVVSLGTDDDNTNALSGVLVTRNSLTVNGAANEHGIMLGRGCEGAEISYNTLRGAFLGIVVKGNDCLVVGNQVSRTSAANGLAGIHLKGASGCTVAYNTAVGGNTSTGAALFLQDNDQTTASASEDNYIHDNIFAADGAAYAVAVSSSIGDVYSNIIDRNCYYGGATALMVIAGVNKTLPAAQTAWAANSTTEIGKGNDLNSINAEPQFFNLAGADFRLLPGSACVNSGSATPGPGKSTIGAWQPNCVTEVSQRSRYNFEDMYTE